MNNKKFVLVVESLPNSFDPIYWSSNNSYDLYNIDRFTSNYSNDEFREYLITSGLIDISQKNDNLQIIYDDKGIRKLSYGVVYKEDYNNNIYEYVINYINDNIQNTSIMNEINQRVNNDRLITKYTKLIIESVFINRNSPTASLKEIVSELKGSTYVDIRIIYLYIKKELEIKDNKIKRLNMNEYN